MWNIREKKSIHALIHRNAHTGNGSIGGGNKLEKERSGLERPWKAPVIAKAIWGAQIRSITAIVLVR